MKKIIFLIAFINAVFIILFFGWQFNSPDTPCYLAGARLIFNLPGEGDCGFRMIKPLALISPGFLEKISGLDAKYGLFFQNLIFYFLATFLIFEIIKFVFKNEFLGLLGSIIFITSPPLLVFGLAYLTDMPGWFFGILGVYLTLRLFEKFRNWLFSFFVGFLIGLGFLFKETALAGLLFFGIYTLLSHFPFKEKLKIGFLGFFGFLLPVVISSLIIYHYFHYSFLDWYKFSQEKPFGDYYNLFEFIKSAASTFYLFWFLFLVGVLRFLTDYFHKEIDSRIFYFLIASGATVFLWPLWPYPLNRVFYLSAPFLVSLASYGGRIFEKKKSLFLALLAGILNFLITLAWFHWRIRGLVGLAGIFYLLILFLFFKPDFKPFSQKK